MPVKVQIAKCNCGKARMMAATETTFREETIRDFSMLMKKGFEIASVTLEEARNMGMCFDGLHEDAPQNATI